MKTLITALAVAAALVCEAETLRLKYQTTVEIVNDAGKVVGTKKLKEKTVIEVVDAAQPAAKAPADKLTPSNISPAVFSVEPPKEGAVLRVQAKLDDFFLSSFNTAKHYSIQVWGLNDDWSIAVQFYGYVEKTSAIGKKVFTALKDGKEHYCLMKLKNHGDRVVTIEDYQEAKPPADPPSEE